MSSEWKELEWWAHVSGRHGWVPVPLMEMFVKMVLLVHLRLVKMAVDPGGRVTPGTSYVTRLVAQ